MKPFIATTLLLGYILLVPFCFFGGMFMSGGTGAHMDGVMSHQMSDCGMPIGGCATPVHSGGIDAAAHHVGMYNSITQTPLTTIVMLVVTLAVFLVYAFIIAPSVVRASLFAKLARVRLRKTREPRFGTTQRILNWLSLFESSPNFA